jgi:5-dehydro-2-deoxygluconokinase
MDRLSLNRFIVLGRVGMDLYADPPGTRIEEARQFTPAIGGSAGNISVALVRQGCEAALLTRVSDDPVGRYCVAELGRYGVDTGLIRVEGGEARNSLAVTETRATGCQTVIYRNGAADLALTVDDVPASFADAGALVVTGTALATDPSRAATLVAMERAKRAGAILVIDIDYRAYSWSSRAEAARVCLGAARRADIVIGNDDEFGLMAGDHAKGSALAAELASHAAFAVYKRGAEGAVTFAKGQSFETPIFPVNALKPTGAGDGFMGGLLAALAQGHSLESAVRRGAATAAIIVAGFGCAPASPDTDALDRFIAGH